MTIQEVAFAALVHGVYVVTTRGREKINGMTAACVSQVSLKPLLVMVSIAPRLPGQSPRGKKEKICI
ncbi:MAG: hypothetical protein FJ121_07305 [Deltaproteobacteria bacterium]|nr:hypothetical protein [Deltaproteobacteria bacterium]